MTSGHILSTKSKLFFTIKLYITVCESSGLWNIYIFCIIIIIMFDFVCDRLGSPSDLVKGDWMGVNRIAN